MRDLAPDIFRQRLLLEGHYAAEIDRAAVEAYLRGLAEALGLRAYASPCVFSPGGGGKDNNQGFDAFLPLIDSGIAGYFWSRQGFFSVLVYSCARFEPEAAERYTRAQLRVGAAIEVLAF